MKVLLQEPYVPAEVGYGFFSTAQGNATFPYGMVSVAAYIRERGHDVSYLDPAMEGIEVGSYLAYLERERFEVIGIGSTTLQIARAIDTFRAIKERFPSVVTVLGSIHGTLMPHETMAACPSLDYIVTQEGEKPFTLLLDALAKGDTEAAAAIPGVCFRHGGESRLVPFDRSFRMAPEEIPIPAFDLLHMERYMAQITFSAAFPTYSVIASRGCPFLCSFCNANDVLGRKVRHKPVETVVAEMRLLKERFGARGIMFHDSTFTIRKRWIEEFCEAYRKSGVGLPWSCNSRVDTVDADLMRTMKKAGLWMVSFGIESANQKSLDMMQKGTTVAQGVEAVKICLELGLCVNTNYIICLPGETEEDALNTIRYARARGNHLASFNLPVPYPKTGLWDTARELGILREGAPWGDYNAWEHANPVYINPLVGKDRMRELLKEAYRSFYTNPATLWRNAKDALLMKQSPVRYWLGLKSVLASLGSR